MLHPEQRDTPSSLELVTTHDPEVHRKKEQKFWQMEPPYCSLMNASPLASWSKKNS
jgi:hypothetical protein